MQKQVDDAEHQDAFLLQKNLSAPAIFVLAVCEVAEGRITKSQLDNCLSLCSARLLLMPQPPSIAFLNFFILPPGIENSTTVGL